VRSASGTVSDFDAPGAGTYSNTGTLAASIDASGTIAGSTTDASLVYHGFVRGAQSGAITTFNAPGSGQGVGQGTMARGINVAGSIAGYYYDASNAAHGFLLTP